MSRLYIQLGKNGDILNVLPLLWRDAQAGVVPRLMVAKAFAPVLEGVSYVQPVIFEGEHYEIAKAVEQAKSLGGEVVCLQVNGPRDQVRRLTYDEAEKPDSMATSFQKESWRVAGRLSEWDDLLPLVFDRRDPARERKLLLEHCKTGRAARKPLMLVSLNSTSSPFAYKPLLLELVHAKFAAAYRILELPQAERIYDLLALYEQAALLIADDSAPLHLAWACRKLPVFALTQDQPLLWHGSPWRPNHHWYCRYNDWPRRAVEMLDCIKSSIGTTPFQPERITVWSDYENPESGKKTWCADSLTVSPGMCGRDSQNAMADSRRVPYLKDVIRMALQRAPKDSTPVVLRRPQTVASYPKQVPDFFFAYRLTEKPEGKEFRPVVDLFCATKAQWKKLLPEIPDLLLSGDYQWGQCLWAIFRSHGAVDATGVCARPEVAPTLHRNSKVTEHNAALCTEYMKRSKVFSRYPKVSEQLECLPLESNKLAPFGYNPALRANGEHLQMVYRFHFSGLSTKLAIADLKYSGEVIADGELPIETSKSNEDAKYFTSGGKPCLSWVDSNFPGIPTYAVVRTGEFINGHIANVSQPRLPGNDGTTIQKNYVFWSQGGLTYCLYQCHPTQKIFVMHGAEAGECLESEAPRWAYGQIRGGTAPIPYEGRLLRFFHSRIENEIGPTWWRYCIGACLMNPEPPFNVLRVSSKPILWGSETDSLTREQRAACRHRKPNVVFPGGVVERDNHWLLSVGVNDAACAIVKVKPENLNL